MAIHIQLWKDREGYGIAWPDKHINLSNDGFDELIQALQDFEQAPIIEPNEETVSMEIALDLQEEE